MQENSAKILKRMEKDLKAKNLRLTEPRRRVFKILLEKGRRPIKAYDLLKAMGDAKPMTVYRALDFLVASGLAHRIESLNAYVPCMESHCDHTDSQYLICDKCENVEELHNHTLDDFIASTLIKTGFHLSHKKMELHGLCEACR